MYEKTIVSPIRVFNSKMPSKSVVVPLAVFLIITFTPGKGWLLSSSTTRPVIKIS